MKLPDRLVCVAAGLRPGLTPPMIVMYSVIIQKGQEDMEATVVDLRYHMNDVLKALARNESVSVLHRGKVKGVIRPVGKAPAASLRDHPFFGSRSAGESVERTVERIRGGRYHDL